MNTRAQRIRERILDQGGDLLAHVKGPCNSDLYFYAISGTALIVQGYNETGGVALYKEVLGATMESLEAQIDRIAETEHLLIPEG